MTDRISVAGAVSLLVGCGVAAVTHVALADGAILTPSTLVIASTTYQNVGAVAKLDPTGGVQLPNKAIPVSDGNYVTVWNNASVDGNFGVTSPITLTDVQPNSGKVFGSLQVPTDQVVTSFPSKSEMALNFTR